MPEVDDDGTHLLKHARVYTLAEKFGVPDLKKLSTSKIHCIDSTAKGEIEYARYVYAHTTNDDTKVRAPIASFWATRSHTLRGRGGGRVQEPLLGLPSIWLRCSQYDSPPSSLAASPRGPGPVTQTMLCYMNCDM